MTARAVNGTAMAVVVLSFIGFAGFGWSMVGLAIWIMLMDLGVQGSHISNQTRIFSLQEAWRNRLNAVYMVSYFLGARPVPWRVPRHGTCMAGCGVCGVGALCGALGDSPCSCSSAANSKFVPLCGKRTCGWRLRLSNAMLQYSQPLQNAESFGDCCDGCWRHHARAPAQASL